MRLVKRISSRSYSDTSAGEEEEENRKLSFMLFRGRQGRIVNHAAITSTTGKLPGLAAS